MKYKKSQIVGFVFTVVIGTLLHFVYEWSGKNRIVALFGAVNESTWEHLKLIFVPMLIFGIFECFSYGRKLENFLPIRVLSILLGMAIIVVGYYTYKGIVGQDYLLVNILLFVLAGYAAYRFSYKRLGTHKYTSKFSNGLAIMGLLFLAACFVTFTFAPPHLQLFLDSSSGTYGISK